MLVWVCSSCDRVDPAGEDEPVGAGFDPCVHCEDGDATIVERNTIEDWPARPAIFSCGCSYETVLSGKCFLYHQDGKKRPDAAASCAGPVSRETDSFQEWWQRIGRELFKGFTDDFEEETEETVSIVWTAATKAALASAPEPVSRETDSSPGKPIYVCRRCNGQGRVWIEAAREAEVCPDCLGKQPVLGKPRTSIQAVDCPPKKPLKFEPRGSQALGTREVVETKDDGHGFRAALQQPGMDQIEEMVGTVIESDPVNPFVLVLPGGDYRAGVALDKRGALKLAYLLIDTVRNRDNEH